MNFEIDFRARAEAGIAADAPAFDGAGDSAVEGERTSESATLQDAGAGDAVGAGDSSADGGRALIDAAALDGDGAGNAAIDAQEAGGPPEASVAVWGRCSPGQAVIGVSEDRRHGTVHSVLCGPNSSIYSQDSTCHWLYFAGYPGFPGDDPTPWPYDDWDYNAHKTECAPNEYVAGLITSVASQVDGIFCCAGAVTHANCMTQLFLGQDSPAYRPPDWDPGYDKGQCAAGRYVSGISALTGGAGGPAGAAHDIHCCSP